ncbi:MAG TPA: hypothetical protein VGU66_01525 [Candidatus Elarobacter sp.]|nr:hypothetical protein [Candidatus Elarobacter sp.]
MMIPIVALAVAIASPPPTGTISIEDPVRHIHIVRAPARNVTITRRLGKTYARVCMPRCNTFHLGKDSHVTVTRGTRRFNITTDADVTYCVRGVSITPRELKSTAKDSWTPRSP